jgi:DNA-directed RNA polymerase specialized sigma24 family protein
MTYTPETPLDRGALVHRYHEQIYRLALLVAGDAASAAELVERAYRELPPQPPDPEVLLIRALLSRRPIRRRWRRGRRAGSEDTRRAALDQPGADALLDLLGRLPPVERLTVGLHYIRGAAPDEIAAILGGPADPQALAEILARFRAEAARTLGLAGADAERLVELDGALEGRLDEEALRELRRAVLEQPELRAARDGMIEARDLLPRAIPALFAALPPPALTERLLDLAGEHHRPAEPRHRHHWARAGLALGVLALAAAIILVPSLLARRTPVTMVAPPTPAELLDAAIHRFDRAPLDAGVLHEQYLVSVPGQPPRLIERWYDYASPHRLLVRVIAEDESRRPLLEVGSDGHSLVQYRYAFPTDLRSVDVHVSETEAQAILPLLRSEPAAWFFSRGPVDQVDISPQFLGQARSADASFLGQTSFLGRQAFLLTYDTDQPPAPFVSKASVQVVLTIDAQTYALLDIAVIESGAAESAAYHPIQAQQIELLAQVPDEQFQLRSTGDLAVRDGLQSAHMPDIPGTQAITLDDAWRRSHDQLLALGQLPDESMRGLALSVGDSQGGDAVVIFYEGEFQRLMLLPQALAGDVGNQAAEVRSSGAFRYRIVPMPDDGLPDLAAEVYRADTPEQRMLLVLVDEYASPAQREATLQEVIASLTPITEETLPALQRNFSAPQTAGHEP